jgi:hypothetical protein
MGVTTFGVVQQLGKQHQPFAGEKGHLLQNANPSPDATAYDSQTTVTIAKAFQEKMIANASFSSKKNVLSCNLVLHVLVLCDEYVQ